MWRTSPTGDSLERAVASREVSHERARASREVGAGPGSGPAGRAGRAPNASRAVWFVLGALGGVVGALALTAYVATTQVRAPQTLVVSLDGTAPFTSIGAAVASSRPGDVVRVEPGIYREHVNLHSGADLVARVPGTVTIARPAESAVPALSLAGPFNVRVVGIKIDAATAGRHRRPHRRGRGDAGAGRDHRDDSPRHRGLSRLDARRPRQPDRRQRTDADAAGRRATRRW